MNEIINNSRIILEQLHFIRADWFYAFIPLLLFLLLASRKKPGNKNWAPIIDAQLMPFVLSTSNDSKQRRYPLLLSFIACSLCITALAGPVYKKLAQPVYREQSSLVVILDLSQSMNASDIKPSRLARAKLELLDILKTRKTGQTALIVYAADAFVVTPLTDDNATIANLIPALETDMMPAQGSRLSIALSKSLSLFEQAGVIRGDILLITDGIHTRDESAIKKITSQGHRLSIFGIGTSAGAPIPVEGGFLKDSNGAIVIPRLDVAKLQRYALTGNALYTGIQADDSDVEKLSHLFQSSSIEQNTNDKKLNADIWQEEGYWLLLPLLFFAALWSRRGWLAAIMPFALPGLLLFSSLHSQPAYADSAKTKSTPLIDSENLWFSPDQKAMKAFQQGDNESAAKQFNNPDWKASAYYRSGNYQAAVETLKNSQHQEAYYNKANALAKLGKYKEALQAYDKAIELNSQNLNSNNEDARYNREQVKQALENQQQSKDQQSDNKDSEEDQENSENKEQQDSDDKQSDKQSDKQDSEDKGDKSQPQDSDDAEQQPEQKADQKVDEQAEQQQLEQRDAEAEKEQQQQEKSDYEQQQKEHEPDAEEAEQIENADSDEKPLEIEVNPTEASISEDERATEQWLKRIPDDPGGLLRRKFYYQYKRAPNQKDEEIEPW
jgi:Ca-activated chloride channel family protein